MSIWDIAKDGAKTLVTKGWLKASHRELDEEKCEFYRPYHKHLRKLPAIPDEIYEYAIDIRDTSYVFKAGHRRQLEIRTREHANEPGGAQPPFAVHIGTCKTVLHKIYHDTKYQSHLLLPFIPE